LKKAICAILTGLWAVTALVPVAATELNVLRNPTLLEGYQTREGIEPRYWTKRGQMDFSNAGMVPADEAYQFSLTAPANAKFPDCSSGEALHYDGSEAGYFQTYTEVRAGETWQASIAAQLMTGGRARLFLYANDDRGANLAWAASLSSATLNTWQMLSVGMRLPLGTKNVVAVLRGRVCEPGTETFRFRDASLTRPLG